MAIKDEELIVNVTVNGKQGQAAINKLERANRNLAASNDELIAKKRELEKTNQTQSSQYKKLTSDINANNKTIADNISEMDKNRKAVKLSELSIVDLRKEITRLKKVRDASTPDTQEYNQYNAELNKVIARKNELISKSQETGEAINEMEGNFHSLGQVWRGLSTGDIPTLKEGLQGITGGIKGAVKASLAFIATPLGLVITALAGIGLAAKQWFDFNVEVEKSNQLVRDITQESGLAVESIRIRAQVLQDTFGTDFQKTIETAKSLVDNLGISYDEAFDIIEDGGVRGKLRNDEFLNSLQEYPVQFKNAGFSAKEFAAIVSTGIDLSIYQDKLPDAIKEFTLSVTEETDAAREALVNAFGKEFTNTLFSNIKSGAQTPKEALQSIAEEAENIGLNSQQAQLLTADLFKGAGEDAGGALKIFEAVNVALNDQAKPLTEIQELQKEQLELNKELNGVYTSLFASADGGFGKVIAKGKIFATKTLLSILKTGVDVYNWIVDLNNESQVFSGILKTIGVVATVPFKIIGSLVSAAVDQFKGLGSIIEGVFTLDFDKVKEGFTKGASGISNAIADIKAQALKDASEIADAFSGNNKLERKSLDDFSTNDASASSANPVTSSNSSAYIKEADAKQKIFQKAEEELTKIIEQHRERRRVSGLSALDQELAAIDAKYAKDIEKFQEQADKIKELEALRDQEKADLKLEREAELAARIRLQEEENRIEEEAQRLEREALAAETEEERIRLLLERTQFIADEELRIEREKELARLELIGATEAEISAVKQKYALQKQKIDFDFAKAQKANQSDVVKWTKLTEGEKLNTIVGALGDAASAFNEGSDAWKATKIAETTITTYQSATNAYNSLAGIPVVGPALGAAAAALAVVRGLQTVSKISSTPLTKLPEPKTAQGFEEGKYPVIRQQDGKLFNAKRQSSSYTQLVTEPTLFTDSNILTGEAGPEIIIDTPTVKALDPDVIPKIYAARARAKGFENGLFPNTLPVQSSHNTEATDPNISTSNSNEIMMAFTEALNRFVDEGVKAVHLWNAEDVYNFGKLKEKVDNVQKNSKIN